MVEICSLHLSSEQVAGEDYMARVQGIFYAQYFFLIIWSWKKDEVLSIGAKGYDRGRVSSEIPDSQEVCTRSFATVRERE